MLVLFTDSDSDVTPELASQYGFKLISMPYSIDDKIVRPYEDFTTFEYKEFYDVLRGDALPSTSALNPEDYKRYFEPVFQNGDDILYIHFSAAISGTFDFMKLALRDLLEKYPDRKFYSIDTKGITICALGVVLELGDMYKRGATVEEMLKWADTEIDKFAMYFYADDLKFLKKSGRVKGITAAMGQLMGVRPIIFMDTEGRMRSIGKEYGRQKALNRLLNYVVELGDDVASHRVIIGHTDCGDSAETLANMLKAKFGDDLNVQIVIVNPTAGCHCGPNSMGVCFHAKHR